MQRPAFGISTRLFHPGPLNRDALLAIGAHGFDSVELLADRSHLDYHNPSTIADLQQWLAEGRLTLHSVHAPLDVNLASGDQETREHAVAEIEKALQIARRIAYRALVVHLGLPRAASTAAADNSRDAARRSLETLQATAAPLGVRLAVEIIPNELSRAGSLVHFLEDVLDVRGPGICLDLGHAHLEGDVLEVVETVAEHIVTVDVHDNRGRGDDHLVPFEGTVDWAGALTGLQKVGYDGPLMLELTGRGPFKDTLARGKKACEKLQRLLAP